MCSTNVLALRSPRAGSGRCRRRRCRSARSRASGRAGCAASRPPTSCASATSPISSTVGPRAAAADAERGRDRPVDPVRAAVGEHPERRLAGREERLDVADRHRGGDDERRLGRQQRAELGGDARLVQPRRPDAPGDRPRRRAVGGVPAVEPARVLALARQRLGQRRRASCAGRRRRSSPTTPAGSCQADSGSKRDLQRVQPRQPRAAAAWRSAGRRRAARGRARARRPSGRAAARRSARSPPGRGGRRTAARPAAGRRRARRRRRRRRPGAGRARRGRRRRSPSGAPRSSSSRPSSSRGAASRSVRGRVTHGRPPSRPGDELGVRHAVAVGHERLAEARSSGAPGRAGRRSRSRTRGRRAGAASARAPG